MLIDDDALAMDVILKVGPEGHFPRTGAYTKAS
jgi:trimethylamine:corrinoid methyltransferase-like protein